MKVDGTHYHAIWLDKDNTVVKIIDQHFLPFRFVIKDLRTSDDSYFAIKDMNVRGAPLIGITAAFGMYLATMEAKEEKSFNEYISRTADKLRSARPTAVNLAYAVDLMLDMISSVTGTEKKIEKALDTACKIKDREIDMCENIGIYGVPLIEKISEKKNGGTVNILTHCNAGWLACGDYGTATAPVYLAHDKGIKVHVWVDETRPRNQGARLTAWELLQHGIPHTVIADNTGGLLMQKGMVDIVITGSDRVTETGDVANKIGTYLKALAAYDSQIPFYVAIPSTTIDWDITDGISQIPIEERDQDEIRYVEGLTDGNIKKVLLTPEKSPALNYGFDITPARLVTGIITEKGICQANRESILKMFPERK